MDGDRFDAFARALGSGRSRRSLLRGLGAAALGAAGLSRAGRAAAANLGNSPCAHFCAAAFPPGSARGACVSAAAHGTGPCAECGANPANYCDGACTDIQTDIANCGGCGNVCPSDACNAATCAAGVCGTAPANAGGTCADAPDFCTNPSTCDANGNCVAGGPISCDDANACTADSCDPAIGCVYTDVDCDDGDACTVDTCDSTLGCQHAPVVCAASDQCHVAGSCDAASGQCSNPQAPYGTPCSDGNPLCLDGACCTGTHELVHGGCFQIDNDRVVAECGSSCSGWFGSVDGSGNYLCATAVGPACNANADCPSGHACFQDGGHYCIAPC